jgi:hypothetical protein
MTVVDHLRNHALAQCGMFDGFYKIKEQRKMTKHPEQQNDELLLGNSTQSDFKRIGWTTKRAGVKSFYSDGSPYPHQDKHGVSPVFVQRSEIESAIDRELADGDRFDRVKLYRKMLSEGGIA